MPPITKLYFIAIVLTSVVLYLVSRTPARSVVGQVVRIVLQMVVIGVALMLTSIAAQTMGLFQLLSTTAERDMILMTLLAYCFVYRHERRWFAGVGRFVGMGVLLALMLGACTFLWRASGGTLVSAMLIPLVLPVMRWIEERLFGESKPAAKSKSKPGRKHGAMDYRSDAFDIRHEAGTDELLVRCLLPANTLVGASEQSFDGGIAALHHAGGLALGERWIPNISCSWSEETITRYGDNSTTTYIPGTTSTGFSSSGEMVTMYNPGTTVTVPGNKTYSYQEKTGKYEARLYTVINNMGHSILLKGIPSRDKPALESVIEAIRAALEEPCRQHNTQEVATAAAQRQEKADAAVRAADAARQAGQDASESAQRASLVLIEQAGLRNTAGDVFVDYQYGPAGTITSLLAADRDARGVLVAQGGADVWTGSWKGAEISYLKDEQELHFKVMDEAYRRQHMKERRLVVRGWSHALCLEWQDRIGLLNAA